MLFNCQVQSSGASSSKLISGNTWGECVAYLEGTGANILSINVSNQTFIGTNVSSEDAYNVSLKDETTSTTSNYIIYDTYSNVISWVNSQSGKSLQNLQYQKRAFVQI
jgi:hypothetical protein